MDVDNGDGGGVSSSMDIEQSLLQQFSCLGTTDKDELVQQLQKLLGSPTHLNYSTAAFFLDMNNWWVNRVLARSLAVIQNNACLWKQEPTGGHLLLPGRGGSQHTASDGVGVRSRRFRDGKYWAKHPVRAGGHLPKTVAYTCT